MQVCTRLSPGFGKICEPCVSNQNFGTCICASFLQCTCGFSANFCLNYVAVKFLGTAKLVVNIKMVAEAELNYYCDRGRQLRC